MEKRNVSKVDLADVATPASRGGIKTLFFPGPMPKVKD